jgi:hypothetical protein
MEEVCAQYSPVWHRLAKGWTYSGAKSQRRWIWSDTAGSCVNTSPPHIVSVCALRFELRGSALLGRGSTTYAIPATLWLLVYHLGSQAFGLAGGFKLWSPYLHLQSSWDYRQAPPCPALEDSFNSTVNSKLKGNAEQFPLKEWCWREPSGKNISAGTPFKTSVAMGLVVSFISVTVLFYRFLIFLAFFFSLQCWG